MIGSDCSIACLFTFSPDAAGGSGTRGVSLAETYAQAPCQGFAMSRRLLPFVLAIAASAGLVLANDGLRLMSDLRHFDSEPPTGTGAGGGFGRGPASGFGRGGFGSPGVGDVPGAGVGEAVPVPIPAEAAAVARPQREDRPQTRRRLACARRHSGRLGRRTAQHFRIDPLSPGPGQVGRRRRWRQREGPPPRPAPSSRDRCPRPCCSSGRLSASCESRRRQSNGWRPTTSISNRELTTSSKAGRKELKQIEIA